VGWQQIRKVVEIGYSVESHANSMIQITDLVAFTAQKYEEWKQGYGNDWPVEAGAFFELCRKTLWSKVQFKSLKASKLKVTSYLVEYAKTVRAA
jgi:hypothetical protein